MRWTEWLLGKEWSKHLPEGKYSELRPDMLMITLHKLQHRIAERFPEAGLGRVAKELTELGHYGIKIYARLRQPIWSLRILTGISIVTLIVVVVVLVWNSIEDFSHQTDGWSDFLQGLEAAINEIIFLSIAIFFLGSLEMRFKRSLALRSLHALRSLAHVVDMHQLTKDPAVILAGTSFRPTESSPARSMTPYQLTRYLEYCSEMLSLTSKLAAMHVQYFDDPVVLDAVNDIESLTQGLSNKVWQKIMILDLAGPE
ncbi:hypothetical protein [Haliscomenobacter hydrossis]|uniref:Membrane associated protein n=1 Tax=Haliscomenobacter hydrossis (strain ATCC 27775 / DSM 1100 / LMG 10767 / O) TaxID=760192 RepID=F4L0S8_HALH1|nr:hypothetical protein [Haliscomenobacter hydrossis]AEE50532.1 putative membrane associated protein [Haliscomenobacter hydrossis DSM 1100]